MCQVLSVPATNDPTRRVWTKDLYLKRRKIHLHVRLKHTVDVPKTRVYMKDRRCLHNDTENYFEIHYTYEC